MFGLWIVCVILIYFLSTYLFSWEKQKEGFFSTEEEYLKYERLSGSIVSLVVLLCFISFLVAKGA